MALEDDESWLDAYLDDELDPAERAAAEHALESDLRRVVRLREHARLRDAVAALPRPACPASLAGPVLARIDAERRASRARRGRLAVAAGLGLAAAALILARVDPAPRPAAGPRPSPPRATHDRIGPVATTPAPEALDAGPSGDRPTPALAAVPEADPLALERGMGVIERQDVRCIYVTIDSGDPAARRSIDALVSEQPRTDPDYVEYTLTQGILIDPSRPGQARVFALVATESEMRALHGALARKFPGHVEPSAGAAPEVLAHLAEVEQIALALGTPGAPVGRPPGAGIIAHREDAAGAFIGEDLADRRPDPPPPAAIVDGGHAGDPPPRRRDPTTPRPAEPILPEHRTFGLLVWVEHRPGAGRGAVR